MIRFITTTAIPLVLITIFAVYLWRRDDAAEMADKIHEEID